MFIIRRLVVLAIFLVAVFIGASVVLENVTESQMSTGIARTFDLEARPTVQIDAFPFLLRVFQGRIPGITIVARDVTFEGLDVSRFTVDMRGVKADLDVLLRSDRFDLHVDQGTGSARITEQAINAFLADQGDDVHVTLRPDGSVHVRVDRVVGGRSRRFEATGPLSLSGRTLTFKPNRVTVDGQTPPEALAARARRETTFSVEIPKLPGGILPKDVAVEDGVMTLVANLNGYVLRLS